MRMLQAIAVLSILVHCCLMPLQAALEAMSCDLSAAESAAAETVTRLAAQAQELAQARF